MLYFYGLIVSTTLLILACGRNEAGRRQLNLVSDDEMDTLGEQAYAEVIEGSRLSRNTRLNQDIGGIGLRIAEASGVKYDWKFAVLEEEQVNAFCLPGGKVAVYTGILPVARNNAGLAAVMGHEVAHAVLRHASERMSQQLLLQTGMSLISLTFSDSPYKAALGAAMGIGSVYSVTLPFSRFQESEADEIGLVYMAKAGFDPREAVSLWERMGELGKRTTPEILSTHPDPENRAKDLTRKMGKALALYEAARKEPTRELAP